MSVVQDNQSDSDYQFTPPSHPSSITREQSFEAADAAKCSDEAHSTIGLRANAGSNAVHRTYSGDQYESEKNAIYRHALFPLLALLFERCEQATRSPDCVSVAGLKADIQLFVQHQQQLHDGKSIISEDPEVDSLMLRAIQTLRIHLLELEKVNELCRDFCTRYIACLRAKMQNEQLLHLDSFDGECLAGSSSISAKVCATGGSKVDGEALQPMGNDHNRRSSDNAASCYQPTNQLSSMNADRRVDAALFCHEPNHDSSDRRNSNVVQSIEPNSISPGILASLACLDDLEVDECQSSAEPVPKHAKHVLKTWFAQHLAHPYPTDEDKRTISAQTDLSVTQVDSWFNGARRRLARHVGDFGDEWSSKRRWCSEIPNTKDSLNLPASGHDTVDSLRSMSSTPSSTAFGCDYLPMDDHSAVDLKPGLELRPMLRRDGTDQSVLAPENIQDSVDSSVESVEFSLVGNNPHIISDS